MDVYRQNIIDHYKKPRNSGSIDNADFIVHEVNTLCGDGVKFFIKFDESKKVIEDIKFQAEGCAISIASSSMLSEELKGKTLDEAKEMLNIEFIKELLGIEMNPARLKCALLCTEALKKVFVNK